MTLADLDGGLVVDGGVAHALFDLAGHGKEGLLDVAGRSWLRFRGRGCRGCLQIPVAQVNINSFLAVDVGITCLCDRVLNNLLVRHVALVAHQQLVHTLCSVAVDLLQPLLDVVETVHVGDIVDNADAVGAAVVGGCDGAEAFLAGRIPLSYCQHHPSVAGSSCLSYDLQLHSLAIELDCSNLEVHADRRDVALGVRIIREPQEQT